MTPPVTNPASTAAAIDPCRRTSLMTRRWLAWPPSVGVPSATDTPSDVPSTLDSMSWVANPLPANSTSTQPASTSRARSGAPPVWTTAGPATTSTFPPRSRAARSRSATWATSRALGFSDDTSEAMNSNIWVSRAVERRLRPARRRCPPPPGRRRGCGASARSRRGRRARRGRSPSRGCRRAATRRRPAPRRPGWWSSRSRRAARRRRSATTSAASTCAARLAPCTCSSSSSGPSTSSSPVTSMRALAGRGSSCRSPRRRSRSRSRPRGSCRGSWRAAANRRCGR